MVFLRADGNIGQSEGKRIGTAWLWPAAIYEIGSWLAGGILQSSCNDKGSALRQQETQDATIELP